MAGRTGEIMTPRIAIGALLTMAGFLVAKETAKKYGPFQMFGPQTKESVEKAAFQRAKALVIEEEGYRTKAYLDTRGILTVGIGHKVLPGDNIKLGQEISRERVEALFSSDIAGAFEAAKRQALELNKYTPEMIAALTSVNFQLGTNWTKVFYNTWAHIKKGNVETAVNNLKKSDWYKQTPKRVVFFIDVLERNLA
jgi:GH24 family phage-related lysozyme (muramidase)